MTRSWFRAAKLCGADTKRIQNWPDRMSIEQVAMLLANGRAGEYRDELDAIRAAIAHGNLCAEGSIRDRDVWVLLQGAEMSERLCAGPCQIVDAAGVLAWLDSQGEWDNEHIRVWHRSQGSTAAPHQEAAISRVTGTKRETQASRIERLLSECERRAAECGATFDRERMPGTKADLLALLHSLDAEMRSMKTVDSLDRYLSATGCKWPLDASAKPSAWPLYARLFPEANIRAPGAVSAQRRKS